MHWSSWRIQWYRKGKRRHIGHIDPLRLFLMPPKKRPAAYAAPKKRPASKALTGKASLLVTKRRCSFLSHGSFAAAKNFQPKHLKLRRAQGLLGLGEAAEKEPPKKRPARAQGSTKASKAVYEWVVRSCEDLRFLNTLHLGLSLPFVWLATRDASLTGVTGEALPSLGGQFFGSCSET